MFKFGLLALLALSAAQAVKLPEVTVNEQLLKKYGVLDNVNAPGYFDNALMKFKTYMENAGPSSITLDGNLIKTLESQVMTVPPATQARNMINLGSLVNAKELIQVVIAQMLNIWEKFRSSAETLNFLVFQKFNALKNASNTTIVTECRQDRMLLTLAHDSMDQFDPVVACDRFVESIRQNPEMIESRITTTVKAMISLAKLQTMVENGDKDNLSDMEAFLKTNSITDLQMFKEFNEILTSKLEEYSEPVKQMSSDPQVAKFITFLGERLSTIAEGHVKVDKK